MSHDVQFWPRHGVLDLGTISSWLGAQRNWSVEPRSALYNNEDTGVYFTVDLADPGQADEDAPLVAAINVYRPSFFGLECAEVLQGLAAEFDLFADDLQDDAGPAEYSQDWLVSRWNLANAAGYSAIANQDASPNPIPQVALLEAWRWNRQRPVLQDELIDDVFVPKIMAIATAQGPSTAVAWTDAIPVVLPLVDYVIVHRNKLLPRKRFRKSAEFVIQTRSDVVSALGDFALAREGRVDFVEMPAPPSVRLWVRDLKSSGSDLAVLRWDRVHDAELLMH